MDQAAQKAPAGPVETATKTAGRFIVLEGIDGAGTTTQLHRLVAALQAAGQEAHATCEPSRGPVGRLLRSLLAGAEAPPGGVIDPRTMALLFAGDRHDHLLREVDPLLLRGVHVVCDRYMLSSLVYQTAAGAPRELVLAANEGVRRPDLTIFVDVPVSVGTARRASRSAAAGLPAGTADIYEDDATQTAVAAAYRAEAAEPRHAPLVTIDGSGSPDDVAAAVWATVAGHFSFSP